MGIDKKLVLVKAPGLETRSDKVRKIRILMVGDKSVLPELAEWKKSSPMIWATILRTLELLSHSATIPHLHSIKLVGNKKRIIEIKKDSARLFAFEDPEFPEYLNLICVETFWIGSGNKNIKQNEAITRAEELMNRWLNADIIEGQPDERIEKRNTGNERKKKSD